MIWGDFHIHTKFSGGNHGKNTVEEIVQTAKEKGLKQIGFSDHGLRHLCYGIKTSNLIKEKNQIEKANSSQLQTFMGIEANIFSSDGLIDLRKIDRSIFDYVTAGFHKLVWPKNFGDAFRFGLRALAKDETESAIKTYTNAYVNAIKTQKIDIISHLNYGIKVDVKQVGQVAKDYGVLIELNGKRINLTDEEILYLASIGTHFILNSDAHFCERVGDVGLPIATVDRLGIDKNLVFNWEKMLYFTKH